MCVFTQNYHTSMIWYKLIFFINLDLESSFSLIDCYTKIKEHSQSYHI